MIAHTTPWLGLIFHVKLKVKSNSEAKINHVLFRDTHKPTSLIHMRLMIKLDSLQNTVSAIMFTAARA